MQIFSAKLKHTIVNGYGCLNLLIIYITHELCRDNLHVLCLCIFKLFLENQANLIASNVIIRLSCKHLYQVIMQTGHCENGWHATEKCYTFYTPGTADTKIAASLATNIIALINRFHGYRRTVHSNVTKSGCLRHVTCYLWKRCPWSNHLLNANKNMHSY